MKNQKGFTLIEMVVVMAVLAILASAIYPRISGYTAANKERFRASQEYVVNKAFIQYYALTGKHYTPPVDYISMADLSDTHAVDMITELNEKTGSMIGNNTGEYKYVKVEGSDTPGSTDIRKVKVVTP